MAIPNNETACQTSSGLPKPARVRGALKPPRRPVQVLYPDELVVYMLEWEGAPRRYSQAA